MKMTILACTIFTAIANTHAVIPGDTTLKSKDADTIQCNESQCTAFAKGSFALTQSMQISQAEALYLDESTTVSVDFGKGSQVVLRLDSDPNFKAGDTSARIRTTIDARNGLEGFVTAQLKWANGTLNIKFKGKYAGSYSANPTLTRTDERLETKEPSGSLVTTAIEHPSLGQFGIQTLVTGDSKLTDTEFVAANGDEVRRILSSFKSKKATP